ncbi:MAG TPA: PilZ domain-containing protein [Polyangia bacterium]|nr:PilZ domain-containing protein [Polyangia bacterium]
MTDHDDSHDDSGVSAERRRFERVPSRSLVEVRLPSWSALQSVYTVNLSMGGMRISLGSRAPLGTAIDIILTLPNGQRLHLPGKVAHLGPAGDGDIGVRFDEMSPSTREEIKRYVLELASGRTPGPVPKSKTIPPGQLIKKKT